MNWFARFFRWLGTPVRAAINLTEQQIKSLFAVSLLSGMVVLSTQNIWYTYRAEIADTHSRSFFMLLLEQLRFNSGLIAWFSFIMGMIIFGANYFRAKWGDKEIGAGRNKDEEDQ